MWTVIKGSAKAVWNWSATKIRKATTAVKKFLTIQRADSRIRSKVKRKSYCRYWSASLKGGYVDIGRQLIFTQAKKMVQRGQSVFTVTSAEAKALAKSAYGGKNLWDLKLIKVKKKL